jgi:hypothetical protein
LNAKRRKAHIYIYQKLYIVTGKTRENRRLGSKNRSILKIEGMEGGKKKGISGVCIF